MPSAGRRLAVKRYQIEELLMLESTCQHILDLHKFSAEAIVDGLVRVNFGFPTSVLESLPVNIMPSSHEASKMWADDVPSLRGGSGYANAGRQRQQAGQGQKLKEDTGFARFLKQHASPQHQRVTAGGRIVPMMPPPEWKLTALRDPSEEHKTMPQKRNASSASRQTFESESSFDSRAAHGKCFDGRAMHSQQPTSSSRRSEAMDSIASGVPDAQSMLQSATLNSLQQQLAYSMLLQNNVANLQALAMAQGLPDASAGLHNLGANQDNYVQAAQSIYGAQLSQPILGHGSQQFSFPALGQNLQSIYPAMGSESRAQHCRHGSTLTGSRSMSFGNSDPTPIAQVPDATTEMALPFLERSLNTANSEVQSLTTQLSNLDRYLAMHTYDIDPSTKQAMIMQRVGLVTSLSKAREDKEEVEKLLENGRKSALSKGTHRSSRSSRSTRASIPVRIRHPDNIQESQKKLNVEAPAWKPSSINKTTLDWTPSTSAAVSFQEGSSTFPRDAERRQSNNTSDDSTIAGGSAISLEAVPPAEQLSDLVKRLSIDTDDLQNIYQVIASSVKRGESVDALLDQFHKDGAGILEKKMMAQAYQQVSRRGNRLNEATQSCDPGLQAELLKIQPVTRFASAWSTGSVPGGKSTSDLTSEVSRSDKVMPTSKSRSGERDSSSDHTDYVDVSIETADDRQDTEIHQACVVAIASVPSSSAGPYPFDLQPRLSSRNNSPSKQGRPRRGLDVTTDIIVVAQDRTPSSPPRSKLGRLGKAVFGLNKSCQEQRKDSRPFIDGNSPTKRGSKAVVNTTNLSSEGANSSGNGTESNIAPRHKASNTIASQIISACGLVPQHDGCSDDLILCTSSPRSLISNAPRKIDVGSTERPQTPVQAQTEDGQGSAPLARSPQSPAQVMLSRNVRSPNPALVAQHSQTSPVRGSSFGFKSRAKAQASLE